ncbi:hypothetical protein Dtox_0633 [Desulfofarcimen acetoxidans DSM 771]|uniref:Uncharacterized protein n=1 Tax=Desulfofarcimen acetoxidans (strain ATCC 49208 / DSM 771 / KCTC 5769 / VKM B-1644 / 5575) TaxID=485916 RepID=C8W1A7_DESAS|nr:hypothetical protein [Desulfofarcimen acetoxidans]ACV61552.1 hypothetical protein Dtox_0633 [Desulfofarcimen acetoxidans DSM 771]
MKINKNGLDEMQKEKRNSIGNQMFLLMFYALLLDCGLYGAGIRWLKYPANIMVIIMVCMGIYLIRTIAANAYLPPKAQNRKTAISLIIAIAFSVVLVIAAFNLFGNLSAQFSVEDANDNSALILFIVSAVGLFISLLVAIIKKVKDKSDSEE